MTLLKKALIFLILALLFYTLIFLALANVQLRGSRLVYFFDENLAPKGTMYRAYQDKLSNGPFDAMVFGSSHAFRGYDPRIFEEQGGINLFNCGTTAQSMPNTYHYLKSQYAEMPTDLVILDVFVDIFEYKKIESSIMIVRNTESDALAWDIFNDEKDVRLLNMMAARYLVFEDTTYYRNPQYVKNGYISKSATMKTPAAEKYRKFEADERAVERFRQLLDYAKSVNMNLVLVNQPRPAETNAKNNEEFSAFIRKELSAYGFPFLDYSMNHRLKTSESFYDLGHMNQHGVDSFNAILLDDLKSATYLKAR